MDKVCCNVGRPTKNVKWSSLKPDSIESMWRRQCPVCKEGVLLVYRNNETLQLEEHDRCILCGQRFKYIDIGEMRAKDVIGPKH